MLELPLFPQILCVDFLCLRWISSGGDYAGGSCLMNLGGDWSWLLISPRVDGPLRYQCSQFLWAF